MVKIVVVVILLSICNNCYSQHDPDLEEWGWWIPEDFPLFNGDIRAFILSNLCYPFSALKDSIEGIVYVSYVVDTLGFTQKHTIAKGIREDLNEEALRVAQLIKYEKPAMLKGKPILFNETIPVKFKLSNSRMMITYIGEPPIFSGDLKVFIRKQLQYPVEAKMDSMEGTVMVSFWIDTLGVTTDHQVIRGIRKDLDKEALRVAKLIRFEKPATQLGKPIKVPFTVPVEFKLSKCSENENKNKKKVRTK